jgi:hypothetical protein
VRKTVTDLLWNSIRWSIAFLSLALLVSNRAIAEPQIAASEDAMTQVTSVSELRDVEPTEWAYEALRSLVERYGCIVGYPDSTYRGNRALTRWEFAAGLNACLNTMERLIQENVAVLKEDVDTIKRLSQEFETELAALGGRVDNLEGRAAFLEDHQFSTTTKLEGEVITTVSQVFGSERADDGEELNEQVAFNQRTRLNFNTSFTGEDRLQIRLQSGNYIFGRAGSNLTDLNFSASGENDIDINKLQYRFPVGENLTVWLAAAKITLDDLSDPLAPFTNSFTEGAISFFGSIAPIYLLSDNTGPGFGAAYNFTDTLSLSAYYSAGSGSEPFAGRGLFNGQYVLGSQLTFLPEADTGIGIAYARSYFPAGFTEDYSLMGFTGTANSDAPFGDNATSADNIIVLGTWRIADAFSIEGWGMYTKAYAEGGDRNGDEADIWNWKVSFAFQDLFQEGNVGVLTAGSPPAAYSIDNDNNVSGAIEETDDMPLLFEAFYVFQLNDNVSITPGATLILNPENDRDPLWVGTIRTSFKF